MIPHSVRMTLCLAAIVALVGEASANGFRTLNPVATPGKLPPGARIVETVPVDARKVSEAARLYAEGWNSGDAKVAPAADYHDGERWKEAMVTSVPRDARLRLESVRSVQTVQQLVVNDPKLGPLRVSTVAATLATRLQFNDPIQGFVSVPGVNEVVLEITEEIK